MSEFGYSREDLILTKDGKAHCFRDNVREPVLEGLAAFREAKRKCKQRITDIDPTPFKVTKIFLEPHTIYGDNYSRMTIYVRSEDAKD
jgi:hypothetical protein